MKPICALLQDAKYFNAFKTVQDYRFKNGSDRPSKKDVDRAIETMMQIEKAKNLNGLSGFAKD